MAKTSIAGTSTTKIRSTIFLTIGLFLLSLGNLVAQDRDHDSGRYMILNAQYGTEHRHVDVTNRLRPDGSMFNGEQFRGWARADWGDELWNGGWNGPFVGHDHDGDRRDHDSGEFVILSAQYGTERRHVDVTRQLKELARRDVRFRMDNHTFGVDPDYGHHKVLRIYARGPEGRERMFEYPEHGWVDGSLFRGWGRGEWAGENDRWSGRWNVEEHDRH